MSNQNTKQNLSQASQEWAVRPADERYGSLAELHAACEHNRSNSATSVVPYRSLRALDDNGSVVVVGPTGQPAKLTNWSFGQLAARVQAPAGYLRSVSAELAAQCLNYGIQRNHEDREANLLIQTNGALTVTPPSRDTAMSRQRKTNCG